MSIPATRRPAVAGQFYPAEPERLRQTVARYIQASGVAPAPSVGSGGPAVAVIVAPHAGYIYSGPTAGFAYARVQGKRPKRVVLLGGAHQYRIGTASVYPSGSFETPLGSLPIDEGFATALAKETGSKSIEPHMLEHSLEVQLPFVLAALGKAPIVPVLFGVGPAEWHAQVGEKLAEMVDDEDLVVASTDLSHYLSEEEANAMDKRSVDAVLTKDWRRLVAGIAEGECSMCGAPAVIAAMAYAAARGADSWTLLDYRTSAHASGDYDLVVGYAAISMERTRRAERTEHAERGRAA